MKKIKKCLSIMLVMVTLLSSSVVAAEAWSAWTRVRWSITGGNIQGDWRSRVTTSRVEAEGIGLNPSSHVNASRPSQMRVGSSSVRFDAQGRVLLERHDVSGWRGSGQGMAQSGVNRVTISGTQRRVDSNYWELRIRN